MRRQWRIEGAGCLCVASLGFVCGLCREAEILAPPERPVEEPRPGLDLTSYGYARAEQDGYDLGTMCSPEEHYEETFLGALEEMLDATRL